MTVQAMTLHIPDALYLQLKQRAEQTKRSVEAEVLDVLAGAIPVADQLPADLESALSPLTTLDDAALERAAQCRLSDETVAGLEALHLKQQREGLSEAEARTLEGLVRQYERNMLVRAQAAALLKQRGHDVSTLVTPP